MVKNVNSNLFILNDLIKTKLFDIVKQDNIALVH